MSRAEDANPRQIRPGVDGHSRALTCPIYVLRQIGKHVRYLGNRGRRRAGNRRTDGGVSRRAGRRPPDVTVAD
jgi:hypothetical protein